MHYSCAKCSIPFAKLHEAESKYYCPPCAYGLDALSLDCVLCSLNHASVPGVASCIDVYRARKATQPQTLARLGTSIAELTNLIIQKEHEFSRANGKRKSSSQGKSTRSAMRKLSDSASASSSIYDSSSNSSSELDPAPLLVLSQRISALKKQKEALERSLESVVDGSDFPNISRNSVIFPVVSLQDIRDLNSQRKKQLQGSKVEVKLKLFRPEDGRRWVHGCCMYFAAENFPLFASTFGRFPTTVAIHEEKVAEVLSQRISESSSEILERIDVSSTNGYLIEGPVCCVCQQAGCVIKCSAQGCSVSWHPVCTPFNYKMASCRYVRDQAPNSGQVGREGEASDSSLSSSADTKIRTRDSDSYNPTPRYVHHIGEVRSRERLWKRPRFHFCAEHALTCAVDPDIILSEMLQVDVSPLLPSSKSFEDDMKEDDKGENKEENDEQERLKASLPLTCNLSFPLSTLHSSSVVKPIIVNSQSSLTPFSIPISDITPTPTPTSSAIVQMSLSNATTYFNVTKQENVSSTPHLTLAAVSSEVPCTTSI